MRRFLFDEQISSQPAAVRDALARVEPPALDPERPLIFAGIGTSLHACRVAAAWTAELSEGRLRPLALEAHELALHRPLRAEDQIVVVSHRGTKNFPTVLLARAAATGANTVAVTGTRAAKLQADVVLRTCEDERSATHTVSYLTALAVLGRLVARLLGECGRALEAALDQVPAAIEAVLARPAPVDVAQRLQDRGPILVTGFGLDAITAPEAALKLKEGTYLWAEGMSVEAALHGPVACYHPPAAAITILPGKDDGGRTTALRQLLAALDVPAIVCGDGPDAALAFPKVPYLVRPLVAIAPLQRLVAELARLRGTNPDTIRSDEEPWAAAMRQVQL